MTRTIRRNPVAKNSKKNSSGPHEDKRDKNTKVCPYCHGKGTVPDAGHEYDCTLCGGSGVVHRGQSHHQIYDGIWPWEE